MSFRTRFAPSPTGPLHLGHAFSALTAYDMARAEGDSFLVRIEDIDQSRARSHWETQLLDDLAWLGVRWDEPILRQSDNMPKYHSALETLWAQGLLYPCYCKRKDILQAASAPQEGTPETGPDGLIYPGTCRNIHRKEGAPLPQDAALRLDFQKAAKLLPQHLSFQETGTGAGKPETITYSVGQLPKTVGDVVVSRRDMGTSYHLSVVVDDSAQSISDVVRGADLFEATAIHVVLQHLLQLPVPRYHHHRLIRDDTGNRLAKRDDARALAKYRSEGVTPDGIRKLVGLSR